MTNKEILTDLSSKVNETILAGEYGGWDDLCVELQLGDSSRSYDGIVIWGEENDSNEKFFSVSLRKGLTVDDPGTEILSRFSNSNSMEDLENTIMDTLISVDRRQSHPISQDREAEMDRFLRINGRAFSFDEVARALGLYVSSESKTVQVELCQRVDSGILVAKGSFFDHDDYPGIDLELQLPSEKDSMPVLISRTEQPHPEGEPHSLRTYGYTREDEYFMFFDSDIRPDDEVDVDMKAPVLTVSGNIYRPVEVFSENCYIQYKGYSERDMMKDSLDNKIRSTSISSTAESSSSHKKIDSPTR